MVNIWTIYEVMRDRSQGNLGPTADPNQGAPKTPVTTSVTDTTSITPGKFKPFVVKLVIGLDMNAEILRPTICSGTSCKV